MDSQPNQAGGGGRTYENLSFATAWFPNKKGGPPKGQISEKPNPGDLLKKELELKLKSPPKTFLGKGDKPDSPGTAEKDHGLKESRHKEPQGSTKSFDTHQNTCNGSNPKGKEESKNTGSYVWDPLDKKAANKQGQNTAFKLAETTGKVGDQGKSADEPAMVSTYENVAFSVAFFPDKHKKNAEKRRPASPPLPSEIAGAEVGKIRETGRSEKDETPLTGGNANETTKHDGKTIDDRDEGKKGPTSNELNDTSKEDLKDWTYGPTALFCLYEYKGQEKGDLSFSAGQLLKMVRGNKGKQWAKAENSTGEVGSIPLNFVARQEEVKLRHFPWYHGKLSRHEVSELLQPLQNGKFVVRESNNFKNDLTLTVYMDGGSEEEHYRIQRSKQGWTIDNIEFLPTILELIEYYMEDANGLCTKLEEGVVNSASERKLYSVHSSDFKTNGWHLPKSFLTVGKPSSKCHRYEILHGKFGVRPVVIKRPRGQSVPEEFYTEAAIMSSLRHPNVERLWGLVPRSPVGPVMLLEHFAGDTLLEHLTAKRTSRIPEQHLIAYILDICRGMCHLESKGIVHRKLAAINVALTETGQAKITNFSCAHLIDSCNKVPEDLLIRWTDPQVLENPDCFTHKSDMWSFSVVIWELYNDGKIPYPKIINPEQDLLQFLQAGVRLELEYVEVGIPKDIKKLFEQAHQYRQADRPTFSEAMGLLEGISA